MVKSGKLTPVEKCYIEHNCETMTIKEIADELDRSLPLVSKHIKEVQTVKASAPTKSVEEVKAESPMFQLMGRHERQGKHVATVMTKAASELADSTRTSRLKDKGKLGECIHKPKG